MIVAAKEKERFAVEELRGFDFRDDDGVVSSDVVSGKFAGELAQDVFEQRNFIRPDELNAETFLRFAIVFDTGKILGISLLLLLQHVDAESLLLFQHG